MQNLSEPPFHKRENDSTGLPKGNLYDRLKRRGGWFTRATEKTDLPEKVALAISHQQDGSERLIGWIQLGILFAFTVLYLIAPKTAPEEGSFEPVLFVLGIYFVFTCMRLYLSYRISLPVWLLLLSVLVDMGLLLGLIWSFHVQYMQPPSFYLKSPALLYIFIFISLRALRFEPGYVLFSGLMGATGWSFLVWLALNDVSINPAVTRDYVSYLTDNKVLLGAEVDKIISIMLVTIILTLAIIRGRRLLISSIVEGTNAQNLSHFVPVSVAAQISRAEGPLIDTQTLKRECSIVFIDLVSFTSLAEKLSPETLILTLNQYFSVIAGPIERHNGVINQFQGDAILASFNLPTEDSNHPASAVSAALEIQETLRYHRFHNNLTLSTRVGVNTGTVVGGFIGTPDRLSYTVYGDEVNIAARLQEFCKSRKVSNLVSLKTRQLCGDRKFIFTPMGSKVLRGRQSAVEVFEARLREPTSGTDFFKEKNSLSYTT